MIEELEHSVDELGALHSRLILLVGPPQSGKTAILRSLSVRRKATPLNVGAELGRCIAGLSHSQRELSASGLLRELADQYTSGELLLVDNIELLFDRSLTLDPLTLLKQLSRVRRVVATWPGEQSGGRLKYAEMGHPEYQDYVVDGLTVFQIQRTGKGKKQ
jgi:hypothetical protein